MSRKEDATLSHLSLDNLKPTPNLLFSVFPLEPFLSAGCSRWVPEYRRVYSVSLWWRVRNGNSN